MKVGTTIRIMHEGVWRTGQVVKAPPGFPMRGRVAIRLDAIDNGPQRSRRPGIPRMPVDPGRLERVT